MLFAKLNSIGQLTVRFYTSINALINPLINKAIELWLEQPEQQETIDRHQLNEIEEN